MRARTNKTSNKSKDKTTVLVEPGVESGSVWGHVLGAFDILGSILNILHGFAVILVLTLLVGAMLVVADVRRGSDRHRIAVRGVCLLLVRKFLKF